MSSNYTHIRPGMSVLDIVSEYRSAIEVVEEYYAIAYI